MRGSTSTRREDAAPERNEQQGQHVRPRRAMAPGPDTALHMPAHRRPCRQRPGSRTSPTPQRVRTARRTCRRRAPPRAGAAARHRQDVVRLAPASPTAAPFAAGVRRSWLGSSASSDTDSSCLSIFLSSVSQFATCASGGTSSHQSRVEAVALDLLVQIRARHVERARRLATRSSRTRAASRGGRRARRRA